MYPSAVKVAAAYAGNIGFEEMVRFYDLATPAEQKLMDRLLESNRFRQAWGLLKKVTGVALLGRP